MLRLSFAVGRHRPAGHISVFTVPSYRTMSTKADSGKSYHRQCTGAALETARAHSDPKDITLFGSCFCPFVQRVWTTFEYLGIDYKVNSAAWDVVLLELRSSAFASVLSAGIVYE